MNIILFGPPGVGKSTLIGILKSKGFRAIDLEDVYPNNNRFQIPNWVDNTFLGGADLNPSRKYHNAQKIILLPSQGVYNARRKLRDLKDPGKRTQRIHFVSDWLDIPDATYIRDDMSAKVLANRLIKIMKSYND